MILLLRMTVRLVLQADEEADRLGGGGGGESGVVLLVLVGLGLGLGDLPVAAMEIQGGESGQVVHLGDGLVLTLQVQRRRTQAFSQMGVTKIDTRATVTLHQCSNEKSFKKK